MSSLAKDWTMYYETDYDMAELNTQMEKVLALCDFEITDEECMKNLKENSGLAFLVVYSFNEVHVFHQVHILGPNLLFPTERIMALSGYEFPTPCYRLNSDYMFANIEVPVPDWDQMKKAQDVASVKSLEVSNRNPPMLKSKNVLAVPPLVVSSIMKSKSTDPVKLLIVLLETIETYDKDSRDPKVSETLRQVAEFLWEASTDNIFPISFSPDNSEGGKK
jgi:hypothetical protein